jgi:hypothetical protein
LDTMNLIHKRTQQKRMIHGFPGRQGEQ